MTSIYYHFWSLKVGTLHVRKIPVKKKCENTRCFFLSHNSKFNQQKQRDVVSKSAAKIYPSNKYGVFPVILLLTNHETT